MVLLMMNYDCDACGKLFKGKPRSISAKEWNIDICISPYEREFGGCDAVDCRYNIEGEVCIEFHFCNKCSKNKSILDNIFKSVEPFNYI